MGLYIIKVLFVWFYYKDISIFYISIWECSMWTNWWLYWIWLFLYNMVYPWILVRWLVSLNWMCDNLVCVRHRPWLRKSLFWNCHNRWKIILFLTYHVMWPLISQLRIRMIIIAFFTSLKYAYRLLCRRGKMMERSLDKAITWMVRQAKRMVLLRWLSKEWTWLSRR